MTLSLVEYRLSLEEARGVAEVSHIVLPYREFPESVPCPRVCPIDERPSLSFKVRYHGIEPVLLMKGGSYILHQSGSSSYDRESHQLA